MNFYRPYLFQVWLNKDLFLKYMGDDRHQGDKYNV